MQRKLFCELGPAAYWLSVKKERAKRHIKNYTSGQRFAHEKAEPLPLVLYKHSSLIRRQLGDVDMRLQENKAINLALAAPKLNGIVIRPGQTFSFWKLLGNTSARKGYQEGLTISLGKPACGVGGGMCQCSNLLHWMALHSPLEIVEHHHHDGVDLFPDFGRKVPFGCGTSVLYNYKDYRLYNPTQNTFQFLVYTSDTHLCGELRAEQAPANSYHIVEEDAHFVKQGESYYRRNRVFRKVHDKRTGQLLAKDLIHAANAQVLYDAQYIDPALLRGEQ